MKDRELFEKWYYQGTNDYTAEQMYYDDAKSNVKKELDKYDENSLWYNVTILQEIERLCIINKIWESIK